MVCPQCESKHIYSTLMGCIDDKDSNKVNCCNCGWRGTAQDWLDIEGMRKVIKNFMNINSSLVKRIEIIEKINQRN